MKARSKRYFSEIFFALLLSLFIPPVSHALLIESTVGTEGIAIAYTINPRLKGEIEITEAKPWEINILDLLSFHLHITGIDPDPHSGPPTVNLHYSFNLSYPYAIDQEGDIPLPFGTAGIETHRWKRTFIPVSETNQIDVSILSTVNKFKYAINLNFGEIFSDFWEGEATFSDNVIEEEVVIDTGALCTSLPNICPPELPGELKWEITLMPIFTIGPVTWSLVKLDSFHDGSLISSIPGDIPMLGEFFTMMPFPLFKGNVHFWFNSEIF